MHDLQVKHENYVQKLIHARCSDILYNHTGIITQWNEQKTVVKL